MEIQHKEMLHKLPDVNKNTMDRIIKVIAIISFFLICSIDQKGFPIITTLLIYTFVSFQELFYLGSFHNILWEGVVLLPLIIGTTIIFFNCETYRDRYILSVCTIALSFSIIILTGLLNSNNYFKNPLLNLYFIIPLIVFLISSIFSIYLLFRKGKYNTD